MIILFILPYLIAALLGWLVISLVLPPRGSGRDFFLFKFFLSVSLGLGLSSCLFFFHILILGRVDRDYIFTEIAIAALLFIVFIFRLKRAPRHQHVLESRQRLWFTYLLFAAFAVALAFSLFNFIALSRSESHGTIMDAWAIWNLRARFILHGGSNWKDAFNVLLIYSQIDYPLLLPLSVARNWLYAGRETTLGPITIAGIFTFTTVGMLYSALALLREKTQGLLAGIVLLGASMFVTFGASQLADIPFSFFMLSTFVLLSLHEKTEDKSPGFLILAGMSAGGAAWTKNEGMLLLLVIAAIRLLTVTPVQGIRVYFNQMASFAAGLTPFLIALVIFKVGIAPPNGLIHPESNANLLIDLNQSKISKLYDLSRYYLTLRYFAGHTLNSMGWVINPFYLFAMYPLCVGIRIPKAERASIIALALGLCLMLGGYFCVYIITPYPLQWHLESSYSRLVIQLWPSTLFLYFMIVRSPGDSS